MKHQKLIVRLIGNWGASFFGPLVSANVAETIYNIGLTFENTLVIAGVSSVFVTGLVLSREAERYGRSRPK